jgi:tRNA(Ile)-lysidine synthase
MPPGIPDTPDRIVEAVRDFASSERLIARGDRVLAAVSGGADSMALLSVLHRLSEPMGFALETAHFHHGIRASADGEMEHVRRAAAAIGVPFHAGAGDVPAEAERTGDSLEEAARKARYRFLHAKAAEVGATRVATGHTRTDHIETVLMRIIRGTGLRGLAGIPPRRGIVVRPLLVLAREDTEAYCRTNGIAFVDDESNRDTRFFRNRVRIELLPLIESRYHAGVRENLARLAHAARSSLERIRIETRPVMEEGFRGSGDGRWELATAGLARLGEHELAVLFGDIFAEKIECDMDFKRVHYEGLVRLALDPLSTGKAIHLPGMTVRKEHGKIVFVRSSGSFPRDGALGWRVELSVPGATTARGATVVTSIIDPGALDRAALAAPPVREAFFDREKIFPPVVLRSPEPGDRMRPFGMSGTKKLSDIFIDKKIPAGERPTSLVIADAHDILWVVGVATSEKCRVRNETREIVSIRVSGYGKDSWSG